MFFKKKIKKILYNPKEKTPVIRISICTGEKTAGFKDIETGRFHEYMLIQDEKELKEFQIACGVNSIENIY